LHIATTYGSTDILEYLINNVSVSVFERNEQGETALSIAQEKKNQRAVTLLESQAYKDQTKDKSTDLLNELMKEE
jgi:ankyrin repeat protein